MVADEEAERSEEQRRLWHHRYRAALEAGLDDTSAELFADAGLDSHALTDLTDHGCEPAVALRILL